MQRHSLRATRNANSIFHDEAGGVDYRGLLSALSEAEIKVSQYTNGATVVTIDVPHAHYLTMGVLAKVGSTHEMKGEEGISHLLEHMLFNGTENRNKEEFQDEIEALNLYVNAYTGRHYTAYHMTGYHDNAPAMADLLSDMVINATLPKRELTRERGSVLEELHMYQDNPGDWVYDKLFAAASQRVPLPGNHSVIGTEESVTPIDTKQLKEYYKHFYNPANLVIIAAGNAHHEDIHTYFAPTIGGMATGTPSEITQFIYTGGEIRKNIAGLQQAHVALGFAGPAHSPEEIAAFDVATAYLRGDWTHGLFKTVRQDQGLVYGLETSSWSESQSGIATVKFQTRSENIAKILPTIANTMLDMTGKLDARRLRTIIEDRKLWCDAQNLSTSSIFDQTVYDIAQTGSIIDHQTARDAYDRITPRDVKAAIAHMLGNALTITATGNIKSLPGVEEVQKLFTLESSRSKMKFTP